jgi:predicted anti-sigma-YlaC factor YlaD
VRRTLSLALDGEAAATDVADIATHLFGCARCSQFAAVAAELTHCLRASLVERPRALNQIETQEDL